MAYDMDAQVKTFELGDKIKADENKIKNTISKVNNKNMAMLEALLLFESNIYFRDLIPSIFEYYYKNGLGQELEVLFIIAVSLSGNNTSRQIISHLVSWRRDDLINEFIKSQPSNFDYSSYRSDIGDALKKINDPTYTKDISNMFKIDFQ